METRAKVTAICRAASEKKAEEIVIIDMRKAPSLCDYFVIASGASGPQVRAIADHIQERLDGLGSRASHVEGEGDDATWILLDYFDVVAHVFLDETRRFYNLERLWADVPQRRFKLTVRKKAPSRKARAARRSRP